MSKDKDKAAEGISLKFGGLRTGHRAKRIRVNEEEEKPAQQYVTGFAENGAIHEDNVPVTVVVDGNTKKVIPTQGNNFRGMGPRAYNPNRFLPEQGKMQQNEQGEDHFELAPVEQAAPVQYGLNTMSRRRGRDALQENGDVGGTEGNGDIEGGSLSQPPAVRQRVLGSGRDWEAEAFQKDVADLPDMSTLEEYEAMPVEAFGEAMLRGMGWSEEKSSKQEEAKEFVRRAPLLGLGATSAPQTHKEKRFVRPGESREPKKDLVIYDEKGNIKHTRTAADKLVERRVKGAAVGKHMRIVKGRHMGIRCKVTAINSQVEGRSQTANVRLHPSEEVVTVRLKELGELEDKPQAGEAGSNSRNGRDKRGAERRSTPLEGLEAVHLEERQAGGNGVDSVRPWLTPHIRVKIIDKRKGQGKLYLKKGEITDVMSPTLCSLHLDSGGRTEASQAELETVVPKKEGSRILVVAGKYRGHRAKLMQRNVESSQAAIQLTEDFSVCKVSFDEIAEYVGDFGDEE